MATLQIKNVPDDLYAALRKQAKKNNRSIAAEVRALLQRNIWRWSFDVPSTERSTSNQEISPSKK